MDFIWFLQCRPLRLGPPIAQIARQLVSKDAFSLGDSACLTICDPLSILDALADKSESVAGLSTSTVQNCGGTTYSDLVQQLANFREIGATHSCEEHTEPRRNTKRILVTEFLRFQALRTGL